MNEKNLIMYMHAGSGNHGCEAIVNSVCHMISEPVTLVSYYGEEDRRYTLEKLCRIQSERRFEEHRLAHVLYYLYRKVTGDKESFIRYRYGEVFGQKTPLAVSIGGDNYCYETMLNDLQLSNQAFNRQGTRTLLLGCSIEPELLLREDIRRDLMHYHTIIARESITWEALKQHLTEGSEGECQRRAGGESENKSENRPERKVVSPRILCYPDPAFTLGKKELPLPEGFQEGNTIGINISPMVQENESTPGITLANYRRLIQTVMTESDAQIALIPHVVWQRNDDRKPIHALYEEFRETGRVVEIPDGSCEELKGYISRCRLFIGARTHATIAAYSSCVPTLVVGYSVKARGIARDLFGTEEHYVLPVQSLKEEGDLTRSFHWLLTHEKEIRNHLQAVMPSYQQKAKETGKEVDRLWEEFIQQPKI